jgi:hypothetical protein
MENGADYLTVHAAWSQAFDDSDNSDADRVLKRADFALKIAQDISDEDDRAAALVAVLPLLPEAKRQEIAPLAQAAAEKIRDPATIARQLAIVAGHLPAAAGQAAIMAGLSAALAVRDEVRRKRTIRFVVGAISKLPRPQMYACWSRALAHMSGRVRREFLDDLCAWKPVLDELGDDATTRDIGATIVEVGERWP